MLPAAHGKSSAITDRQGQMHLESDWALGFSGLLRLPAAHEKSSALTHRKSPRLGIEVLCSMMDAAHVDRHPHLDRDRPA